MTTRIYTRTGDRGDTGLFGGQRVKKDSARVEAYGTVDEFNAHLGMARALLTPPDPDLDAVLHGLQNLAFDLGAELATPPSRSRRPTSLGEAAVTDLEAHIDRYEAELAPLKTFILPGGTGCSAALHVARSVCRRAERATVTLLQAEPETAELPLRILNRVSDLLFVMARVANARASRPDVGWSAR